VTKPKLVEVTFVVVVSEDDIKYRLGRKIPDVAASFNQYFRTDPGGAYHFVSMMRSAEVVSARAVNR
jgi:hypothetical protein